MLVAGLLLLIVQGMAQGTTALDTVKERTAAGLARETAAMAAAGDSAAVTWSTTPTPRGGAETVVARLEGNPSGSYRSAAFLVADGRVTPMDALARRLLAGTGGAGSPARATMDDGMPMNMNMP